MVLVEINSNALSMAPTKSRNNNKMKKAYKSMMALLRRARLFSRMHILYNKMSTSMKAINKDEFKMKLGCMLTGYHRRNAAEATINIFKAHFAGVLVGVADSFPMQSSN